MSEGSKMQLREEHAGSTDQQPPPEPPSILRLKDEYGAPEHEELVRLTLTTGSNYQSPPQEPPPPSPPKSPLHPSLLQLMPSSSFFSRSSAPPLESQLRPSFLQLLSEFSSQSPEQQRFLSAQAPAPPISQLHPSLILSPSSSKPPADQTSEGPAHRYGRKSKKQGWEPITIEPPYPWASTIRAKFLSMEDLISKNIIVISGDVYCKECKKQFQIEYDSPWKFSEFVSFIAKENDQMHNRAPDVWLKPAGLNCRFCNKSKCVQQVTFTKKRQTNWLFLFLGQMIGYCNVTHLRYFCKHNNHPRFAAKDQLVYLAYTTLHCQLDPKAYDLYNK